MGSPPSPETASKTCARSSPMRELPTADRPPRRKSKPPAVITACLPSIRRNMRNYLVPLADKVMLRKRFVIETVLDTLKSEMGLEHSRHRSVINAMVHVLSCLVAYAFRPGKPSISLTAQQITAYP